MPDPTAAANDLSRVARHALAYAGDGSQIEAAARRILALAQLLDPADLPDRMAEALYTSTGVTVPWPAVKTDPELHLVAKKYREFAEAALSVRWEAAIQQATELAQALARADHAGKAAVVNRERGEQYRQERDEQRRQLAALVGVDPCTEWGDILDSAHQAIGGGQ